MVNILFAYWRRKSFSLTVRGIDLFVSLRGCQRTPSPAWPLHGLTLSSPDRDGNVDPVFTLNFRVKPRAIARLRLVAVRHFVVSGFLLVSPGTPLTLSGAMPSSSSSTLRVIGTFMLP